MKLSYEIIYVMLLIQNIINLTNMKHASHALNDLMRRYLRIIINIAIQYDEHICKLSVAWRNSVPFLKPMLVIYVTQMSKIITYLGLFSQE